MNTKLQFTTPGTHIQTQPRHTFPNTRVHNHVYNHFTYSRKIKYIFVRFISFVNISTWYKRKNVKTILKEYKRNLKLRYTNLYRVTRSLTLYWDWRGRPNFCLQLHTHTYCMYLQWQSPLHFPHNKLGCSKLCQNPSLPLPLLPPLPALAKTRGKPLNRVTLCIYDFFFCIFILYCAWWSGGRGEGRGWRLVWHSLSGSPLLLTCTLHLQSHLFFLLPSPTPGLLLSLYFSDGISWQYDYRLNNLNITPLLVAKDVYFTYGSRTHNLKKSFLESSF